MFFVRISLSFKFMATQDYSELAFASSFGSDHKSEDFLVKLFVLLA
jgi:hypothetical protein